MDLSLNFKDYAKKLEKIGENVPKVFKQVAGWGAKHAEKTAVELTDYEKLVDTGAYKRNWHAEVVKDGENYGITLQNNMEYASHLEWGHKLRGDIPYAVKRPYKIKRPRNMEKGRYKGFFVGKRTLTDLEGWALIELRNEIDVAMTAKKYNISKGDARKLIK